MLKFSSHLLSPPLLLSLCNSLSLVHSRESASPSPRNYAIRLQSPYKVDLKQLDFIQSTDFISIRKFIYHNFSFIGIFVKSTANNFFPSILAALFILFVHTTNAWAEHCSFVCIMRLLSQNANNHTTTARLGDRTTVFPCLLFVQS